MTVKRSQSPTAVGGKTLQPINYRLLNPNANTTALTYYAQISCAAQSPL